MAKNLNIILFGCSQQGKSCIISNLCDYYNIDHDDIKIGGDLTGCTFGCICKTILINEIKYNFYDTNGLNEAINGKVSPIQAFHNLRELLNKLKEGVSLMIYVKKKSSFITIDDNNLQLFRIMCGDDVPLVLLVNDADIDEAIEYSPIYDIFKNQINETWNKYISYNLINIKNKKVKFQYCLCGYHQRTGGFPKTSLGILLRKASVEVFINLITTNAIKNHLLYHNLSGLIIIMRKVINFFAKIIYNIKNYFLDCKDIDDHRLMSKSLKEVLVKFGIDSKEAEEIAMRYEDPKSFLEENK